MPSEVGSIKVDVGQAAKTLTVQIQATGVRRLRVRWALARPLLHLACWVGGFAGFTLERSTDRPATGYAALQRQHHEQLQRVQAELRRPHRG